MHSFPWTWHGKVKIAVKQTVSPVLVRINRIASQALPSQTPSSQARLPRRAARLAAWFQPSSQAPLRCSASRAAKFQPSSRAPLRRLRPQMYSRHRACLCKPRQVNRPTRTRRTHRPPTSAIFKVRSHNFQRFPRSGGREPAVGVGNALATGTCVTGSDGRRYQERR
jgi:hypothetical protein